MVCSSPVVSAQADGPVLLDAYEMDRVRFCAKQLSRMRSFCRDDADDIAGDLLVEIYRALPRYDPNRASRHTFICRVIATRRKSLIRDARRRFHDTIPLDGPSPVEVDHDVRHRMTGYTPLDEVAAAERAEAVGKAIERLPLRLREIAVLLMHHSQADVARILGVSETSIDRARKQIFQHFMEIGSENLF